MADDVAGFIDEHKLHNTTLIGHSMGAKTAMTLALQSPDLIDNIVSVDNAPIDAALLSSFGKYVQGMKRIEEAGVTKQAEADAILKDYEESLPVRQFLLGNLHRPAGEKTQKFKVPLRILGAALDNLGDFPFKDPGEVRFAKPTLFVRGTQSKYIPDEALPIIGQFFPRFELADIDAGHWVTSEKPEEFRQALHAVERFARRDVVDEDDTSGAAVVGGGERAEPFLACGVEEVESVGLAVDGESFELFRIFGTFVVELVVAISYKY
ncbi:putative Abhydrolase domain-containing protein C22H12.03 [Glarea lozoyensis 74030]|uniref:Putative Abhydrolase domain-containing protein C22H12.03 n=1 Tax=Glarea lozoyensis (strain ATCC 74030 / MF5533) TaxID=1104152 RepID=H0EIG6_GLAL7|nr:putative Abhydrolase domain-containing protein C22H12.03 [Glarea lozoyensis 74030]